MLAAASVHRKKPGLHGWCSSGLLQTQRGLEQHSAWLARCSGHQGSDADTIVVQCAARLYVAERMAWPAWACMKPLRIWVEMSLTAPAHTSDVQQAGTSGAL